MNEYKNLLFLRKFLNKSKHYFIIGIIGMCISSLLFAPIPYLIGYIIDKVILVNASYINLFKIISIILLLNIFSYIVSIIYQYYFAKLQQNIVNEIRISMIDNIIDTPLCILNKKEKGYILSRISEVGNIGSLFSPSLLNTFTGVFDFFYSLIIMFSLNFKLTILVLFVIPVYFIISRHSAQKIYKTTINVYESSAILNGDIYEILNGLEDIKLLNGKDTHMTKLRIKINNVVKNVIKQSLSFIFFVQNIILSNNIITSLVLLFSGILILDKHLTVGIYTSFSVYLNKILTNTQSLGSLEITLKPICISIRRIKEIFDLSSKNPCSNKKLTKPIESIIFKDVNFRYDDTSAIVLDNLNTAINKGDKVLISGRNGSGKTTLIKLITGLYYPTNGHILINNEDYSNFNIKDIRSKIGIVSQNIFLFKGTVLENILYGYTNKTKTDVIKLINDFELTPYIKRFDNGLDTMIIQNGSGLSGGQAQIIAFLRVVINKRDVIILDEATSNLDINTRKIILKILKEKNLCDILIIISHQNDKLDFINKTIELG